MNSRVQSNGDDAAAESSGDAATKTDPVAEIAAMGKVAAALAEVDLDSARRILRWATERFGLSSAIAATRVAAQSPIPTAPPAIEDLGEFFANAAPKDGPEKALTVGYWLQVVKGLEDLEGQTVNSELKNLGHGLPNITATMSLLMSQQPALVIQTRKIGSSQQGRKRYRLTGAGIARVRQMLEAGGRQ
jgi:hypothetical protein